ncbi:MAG: hypothetical protein MJ147_09590 [Clostridia bacterium]|nr:hypothetical protein [Clostridia bacterium]
MAFPVDPILKKYDVFPLVFSAGKEVTITIRSLGSDPDFISGEEYNLEIVGFDGGNCFDFPLTASNYRTKLTCTEENGFVFSHTFETEQEYNLMFSGADGKVIKNFCVYAVDGELKERYPFIGDLHLHTYLSDGDELPEVVCANYRRHGYDFLAITDHRRYYPSLRAIKAYEDCPTELTMVPGEEVHLPLVNGHRNDIHIINFGGEYSINAMVESVQTEEVGKAPETRAFFPEKAPDVMTLQEFEDKMQALADEADLPDNIERIPYAMCKWIFDEIKKANGLGIFAHPNWKRMGGYHSPEIFSDYMFAQKPFDAFEVLGGERYYEQNGFQTIRYYEEVAKGHKVPIVGSTDSHSSYSENKGAYICSTIVFAHENERTDLIQSIKDYYSVAVDTISTEFRLVGEMRLAKYSCFLLKYYFPLHDEICYEEGRLMKQYVTGTEDEKAEAKAMLKIINGRADKLRKKYICL